MPIFEYKCDHCSYTFDKLTISRDAQANCPLCQGEVRKLMSTFSVGVPGNGTAKLPEPGQRKMCTSC